jgi:tyrosyl-tRNA synthetase
MFGKLMSVSDELMWRYYELLTDEDVSKIKNNAASGALHPKQAKVNLAKIIVTQYHGPKEAVKQAEEFDRAFKDKGFPTDAAVIELHAAGSIRVADLLVEAKLLPSRGEAKRKIQEGAVEIDDSKVSDVNLAMPYGREYKIRVGKKFARVFIRNP